MNGGTDGRPRRRLRTAVFGALSVSFACGTATTTAPALDDADASLSDAGSSAPDTGATDASNDGAGDRPIDDGAANTDADDTASDGGIDTDASPCPLRLPATGDPLGVDIERDAFGCYGACGPSCKAECVDSVVAVRWAHDGACVRCEYRVKECKSHAFCRWHDDCYRQCDLRWEAEHTASPASPPSNPCYRTCDNPVLKAAPSCAVDWTQIGVGGPSVRDACWDGSWVTFSELEGSSPEPLAACDDGSPAHAAPWDASHAAWSSDASPTPTLPRGYSCTLDTDCPDRNETCDPDAGDYPGVNGWGRCTDSHLGVDVTPLVPEGLVIPDAGALSGAPCAFDDMCASGHCAHGVCKP